MKKLFKACVLIMFISFGNMVFAADASLTVSDAHEYIGELLRKELVSSKEDQFPGDYWSYKGDGCNSSMRWGNQGAHLSIDWSEWNV